MGLYFHNATGSTIELAYAAYSRGCASEGTGQPYLKKGWYIISAGETQKVWSGYAGPERFYYYAESSTRRWSGPWRTQVHPTDAFQWCWGVGSTAGEYVGFRQISPSSALVPPIDRTISLR
jgi:hypothetical protein